MNNHLRLQQPLLNCSPIQENNLDPKTSKLNLYFKSTIPGSTEEKVNVVLTASLSHPDRATFFQKLWNPIREIFGKTAVKIEVKNGDKVIEVYVRIKDLNKVGISKKEMKNENSASISRKIIRRYERAEKVNSFDQLKEEFPALKNLKRQEIKNFSIAFQRIDSMTFQEIMKRPGAAEDYEQKMIKTFVEMGKTLTVVKEKKKDLELYQSPSVKGSSYAFALQGGKTYICLDKTNYFLGQGTSKMSSLALKLEQSKPVEEVVRLKSHGKIKEQIEETNASIQEENRLAEKFYNEENGATAAPFSFMVTNQKTTNKPDYVNKVIAFQKQYDTVGIFHLFDQPSRLVDLGKGLAQIHAQGHVHSDVKTDNVLVNRANGRLVLTDFGGTVKQGGDFKSTSPLYAPPEYYQGKKKLDSSFDSFSYGMLIVEELMFKTGLIDESTLSVDSATTGKSFAKVWEEGLGKLLSEDKKPEAAHKDFFQSLSKNLDLTMTTYIEYYKAENEAEMVAYVLKQQQLYSDLIEVVKKLTEFDPNTRLSCLEAAEQIENAVKRFKE